MMDDDEFEANIGMPGKRNQSTQRKPAPVALCPPQIPHDPNRAWTLLLCVSYGTFQEGTYSINKDRYQHMCVRACVCVR
jgi:hypothetical protein